MADKKYQPKDIIVGCFFTDRDLAFAFSSLFKPQRCNYKAFEREVIGYFHLKCDKELSFGYFENPKHDKANGNQAFINVFFDMC